MAGGSSLSALQEVVIRLVSNRTLHKQRTIRGCEYAGNLCTVASCLCGTPLKVGAHHKCVWADGVLPPSCLQPALLCREHALMRHSAVVFRHDCVEHSLPCRFTITLYLVCQGLYWRCDSAANTPCRRAYNKSSDRPLQQFRSLLPLFG
jgi:hypothetical protein